MDKYTLLLLLNLPFIVYGFVKSVQLYRRGSIQYLGLTVRIVFWTAIFLSLLFVQEIYSFLVGHRLTDSAPLSLPDVVLTTGIIFCLFLCMRLYSKIDASERKLSDLHEKLSIELSKTKRS